MWPGELVAQSANRLRRLGVLMGAANDPAGQALLAAFLQRLKELRWNEDNNIRIDYRWGAGDADRGPGVAAELVGLQPDVIFFQATPIAALQHCCKHRAPVQSQVLPAHCRRILSESVRRSVCGAVGRDAFRSSQGAQTRAERLITARSP